MNGRLDSTGPDATLLHSSMCPAPWVPKFQLRTYKILLRPALLHLPACHPQVSGTVIASTSVVLMCYALYIYKKRSGQILRREAVRRRARTGGRVPLGCLLVQVITRPHALLGALVTLLGRARAASSAQKTQPRPSHTQASTHTSKHAHTSTHSFTNCAHTALHARPTPPPPLQRCAMTTSTAPPRWRCCCCASPSSPSCWPPRRWGPGRPTRRRTAACTTWARRPAERRRAARRRSAALARRRRAAR